MRNLSNSVRPAWPALLLFLCLFSPAQATQNITLKWDPDPASNAAGYRLYYGTSTGQYTQKLEVGNTTVALVSNLAEGRTYFFAVTAYNRAAESLVSNEVSFTVPNSTATHSTTTTSTATPAPAFKTVTRIVTPPAKLNDIRDMQVRVRRHTGSVEASAFGRWCRGEP